ncbi:uncharacterized protein LOC131155627 [Malania oleifera]|uniref:uncharacterized protein LOC131155627 n=1 Tax=Malania oleifera TaxID=397392 RepID=UPI0025ADDBDE|nr:uncharacterized protein LOC131155627 [Malania oleifera]
MVGRRKRAKTSENGEQESNNEGAVESRAGEVSGYEESRDRRIRENMQRMQQLGILDLSHKLKSDLLPSKRPRRNSSSKDTSQRPPLLPSGPPRRSSRLKDATPVSYSEQPVSKKEKSVKNIEICLREGSKPEIYTEEHDKLLGECKTGWTLFVDGYGQDGKRIYDSVKGKTCHQCRQKTLGQHTCCCKCNLVQGQFCGDCLYMRYGENVTEANQNPSWICPVCRGICNCSLCRQAKGWAPTGSLYRKIARLGFKSVAHYLIQTHRSQTNSEDANADNLLSAERSQLVEDTDGHSSPENKVLCSDEVPLTESGPDHNGSKDDEMGDEKEVLLLENMSVGVSGASDEDDKTAVANADELREEEKIKHGSSYSGLRIDS